MAYLDGNYNGVVYVGNVKWSDDNKNQMLFTNENHYRSATARHNFLINHLTRVDGNICCIPNPNGYIDIDCTIQDIEQVNYCYYKNDSDFSNTYYCCFVTNYEITADNTTRLFLKWDYFQQFFYTTTLYQCFIERMIVNPSDDTPDANTLPEPISATLEKEFNLTADDENDGIFTKNDWSPEWVLHAASYYDPTDGQYHYEGAGSQNTFGEYAFPVLSATNLRNYLKLYGRQGLKETLEQAQEIIDDSGVTGAQVFGAAIQGILGGIIGAAGEVIANKDTVKALADSLSIAQYQDHRDELIGLYAIPKWLADAANAAPIYDNREYTRAQTITLNTNVLANGYRPRNKKLLSSVCRGYVLANKTGLKIVLKPELFTASTTQLQVSGIPTSISGYMYHLTNYADYQKSYGEVSYCSERRVGYDANTGINKAINTIGAGAQALGSLGAIAGGIATANPAVVASGAGGALSSGIRAIDTLGNQEAHFGSNGDLLRITNGRAQLSFYEINPLYNECVAIDNFFDMYGYTINKHATPNLYTRSEWNYIKTSDFNCTVPAPADAENAIKDMFNAGITLWFNYDHFGDYTQPNGAYPAFG